MIIDLLQIHVFTLFGTFKFLVLIDLWQRSQPCSLRLGLRSASDTDDSDHIGSHNTQDGGPLVLSSGASCLRDSQNDKYFFSAISGASVDMVGVLEHPAPSERLA